LPDELQAELDARTSRRGISDSAWIEEAVREKLASDAQLEYLEARAARGNRAEYDRILGQVPATEPMPGDER
jgi:metal-responsive CopG/Arc/MetJ family transcriptional regulator